MLLGVWGDKPAKQIEHGLQGASGLGCRPGWEALGERLAGQGGEHRQSACRYVTGLTVGVYLEMMIIGFWQKAEIRPFGRPIT